MPTMALPNEEKPLYSNKPTHEKNNSGEIDVFEAAGYYAGTNDHFTYKGQSEVNKLRQSNISRGRCRTSLDIVLPMRNQVAAHDPNEPASSKTEIITKNKKNKQPSSPGAKISHFLNSFFHQKVPNKKKFSSSSSSKSSKMRIEDDEVSDVGSRRKTRRSSISGFWTATTRPIMVSKPSIKSMSPPPLPPKQESLSRNENNAKKLNAQCGDVETKDSSCGLSSDRVSKDSSSQEKEGFKEFGDGWDSDSSSDLFELQLGKEFRFPSSDRAQGECVRRIIVSTATTMVNNGPVKS